MSVYALSFFTAPSGIVSSIESILKCFIFGGSDDYKKVTWVDWNYVCLRKEVGGLGVRRIRKFNSALLGKWCWRLLIEKESLRYRVLSARFGEEGGRLLDGRRSASAWWRAIAALQREEWFNSHVDRLVGNGKKNNFLVRCLGWWDVL